MKNSLSSIFLTLTVILYPALVFAKPSSEVLFNHFQNTNMYQDVIVEKVLSADTIVVDNKKIRLIGLKAPDAPRRPKIEYDKNGLPIENPVLPENTLEEKAYAFASQLLLGKHVRVEFDESKNDDDFTTLGYVFLIDGNTFANTHILRYGYADLQIKPPNLKYEDDLRDAYREARREKRGLQSN